jgi:hypothetical protein
VEADEKTRPSRWGKGIAAVYAAFVVIMVGLVIFSRYHRADLVARDYYDRETKYQQQIDRLTRSVSLETPVTVSFEPNAKRIMIQFPREFVGRGVSGNIQLFRPSEAALDREFAVKPDNAGLQLVNTDVLRAGLWKVKILWRVDTLEFYDEQALDIE